ncbi:type VII toxin-antitoxin system MntA family adenylyltransferase antitoxin [Tenuibacillus multivorans]|uniref:Predicted nucleotidyltransferase n=1 Tax=Tenuibacillus multivorans TaxID=237069 RepID=A0A1H0AUI8_9BACI|nr:nucleotidyltransferase domain-containing protein [Tenuibacillus multivorans]GEL77811.1 nucleotidyltransferase [Tenuibacillus multivorans]SDN37138.1 Predicted nucleotidyltransferase [Tenuibacillus multivorans]
MDGNIKGKIVDYLLEKVEPVYIILFGSQAKGDVHESSDVDLAFFSYKDFSSYERFIVAQELADIIGFEVDLIDLKDVSTVMKAQIFHTGEVIYCANETLRQEHHMYAYSFYAKLNEERQVIIDRIKESGTIYGE